MFPSKVATDKSKLDFLSKINDLLNSDDHSDLTIKVGTATFRVQKCLLSLRTPYFTNATKEGGFAEAKDNTVTIEEHSAHSVWRFLTYCYSGDYNDETSKDLDEQDDPLYLKHSRVYALADMLDAPELKIVAAQKLNAQLAESWVPSEFPRCVSETYDNTNESDTEIRKILVEAAAMHIAELLKLGSFHAEIEDLPGFSLSLLMNLNSEDCTRCKLECYNCDRPSIDLADLKDGRWRCQSHK